MVVRAYFRISGGGAAGLVLGCLCCLKMCVLQQFRAHFIFFKGRWFCRFSTSTGVRSCHARLSIGVFVLLESVRFMMVSCSFQLLCKRRGCQFIGDLPFPLVHG